MPTVEYETSSHVIPFNTDSMGSISKKRSRAPIKPKKEAAIRHRLRPKSQTQGHKLQIIPVLGALKQGKMPNNDQLCHLLQEFIHSPLLKENEPYLSLQGLKEWRSLQEWMQVTISIIKKKNANSELQKFMFHSRLAAVSLSSTPLPGTQHLKEIATKELNLLDNLQKTALTLLFNAESRESFMKLVEIVREMFSEFESTEEGVAYLDSLSKEGKDESMEKKSVGISEPSTVPLHHTDTDTEADTEADQKVAPKSEKKVSFSPEIKTCKLPGYQLTIEHRRELVKKFQTILQDIHKDPKSSELFEFLLKMARQFEIQVRDHVLAEMKLSQDDASREKQTLDANLKEALDLLKTMASHFANEKNLDPLFASLLSLKECLETDFELRELLDDLLSFFERSFGDKTYTNHPDSYEKGIHLIERGRECLFEKHKSQIESVFTELDSFLNAYGKDGLTSDWIEKGKQFSFNLFESVDGKTQVNSYLLRDSLVIFLPVLLDHFQTIPIPRVEHSDSKMHYIIDGFELNVDDILPSALQLKSSKEMSLGIREDIQEDFKQSYTIVLHEIQFDVQNIPFCFMKKQGFPKIKDYGVAQFKTSASGLSIQLQIDYYPDDPNKTLGLRHVQIHMDSFQLKISDSQHDGLYSFFRHTINNVIKSQVLKSSHTFANEWIKKADAYITPRKKMYMKEKPGVSEFEQLLNRFGITDERVSEKASSESIISLESKPGPSTPLSQDHHENRIKSKLLSPWESEVFAF